MKQIDPTSLATLRPRAGGDKRSWRPPTEDDLAFGHVLAFDQSLTATGWAFVEHTQDDGLRIVDAGKFGTAETSLRGITQSLTRAEEHHFIVLEGMRRWCQQANVVVAYETPAVATPRTYRVESSQLTALSVRIAAATMGLEIVQVGAQSAKNFICGNPQADKKGAHAALVEHFGGTEGYGRVTNEAARDALMLALTALARKESGDAARK